MNPEETRLKPIKPATVQEQVFAELLHGILTGHIPPGDRITIEGMARQLDVSLMPVRVAVQKLEARGFLTIGKNRRITVHQLTPRDLEEVMALRLLNEGYAAEQACRCGIDGAAATTLKRLVDECGQAPDAEAFLAADREFHHAIYSRSDMPLLLEIIDSLQQRTSPYWHILFRAKGGWRNEAFSRYYKAMLQAVKEKDSQAARLCVTEQLTMITGSLKGLLEAPSPPAPGRTRRQAPGK